MNNKGTQVWNHQHIYELFNRKHILNSGNQSLVVLITNNDEDSDKALIEYQDIKKKWD